MPQTEPLVSVVMPVFNGLPFVVESVHSILNQDYRNFKLHIVDNASSDGTTSWLRSLSDPRVSVLYRDSTQPAADNWSQATELANGAFTKLVCADDLLDPSALSIQVAEMLKDPSVVMAASQRNVIDSSGKILKRNYGLGTLQGVISGGDAMRACLRSGTNLFGEPFNVLFRTTDLKSALPWGGSSDYLTDLATYSRVLLSGNLVCIRSTAGSFRVSPNSWTSRVRNEQASDFRRWRDAMVADYVQPWTWVDRFVSALNLQVRTRARHWYLRRA